MDNQKKLHNFSEYLTVDAFRAFPHGLDLSGTTDSEIEQVFDLVGYWIQDFTNKPILAQVWTDNSKGNGTTRFHLSYPAKNIISAREIIESDNITLLNRNKLRIDKTERYVEYDSGYFYSAYTYSIQYNTGTLVLPKKVVQAVYLTAAEYINSLDYRGMRSIKIDTIQVNIAVSKDPLPVNAQQLLTDWIDDRIVV